MSSQYRAQGATIAGRGPRAWWALSMALIVAVVGSGVPSTAGAQTPGDSIELVDLATRRAGPRAAPGAIGFEIIFKYELRSAPSGSLKVLIQENRGAASVEITKEPIRVEAGAARLGLELDYAAPPTVESVQLVGELYNDAGKLLDSFSTIPLILPRGGGREPFEAGIAARDAGQLERAEALFGAAIQEAPEIGQYHQWRADVHVRLGRYAEAVQGYTRALELMPNDRASRVGRGVALVWLEHWEAALQDLSAVIDEQAQPDQWTAWAHRARGLTYSATGQPAAARAEWQAYLQLRPNAPDRATIETWVAALP